VTFGKHSANLRHFENDDRASSPMHKVSLALQGLEERDKRMEHMALFFFNAGKSVHHLFHQMVENDAHRVDLTAHIQVAFENFRSNKMRSSQHMFIISRLQANERAGLCYYFKNIYITSQVNE
jgi:hypothetical protein